MGGGMKYQYGCAYCGLMVVQDGEYVRYSRRTNTLHIVCKDCHNKSVEYQKDQGGAIGA